MICPACKQEMIVVEYNEIELDYCTSCKGTWFDSGELELLLKSHGVDIELLFENIPDTSMVKERSLKCPVCSRKLLKITVDGQDTIIDKCKYNHGLWFDAGEISKIVRNLAERHLGNEALDDVAGYLEQVFSASE